MPKEKKHEVLMDADVWDEKVFKNEHEVINRWLKSKDSVDNSRRTLNTYSRTAAKFFHEVFPELSPEEVYVEHVEEYLRQLDERDVAQNTKRRYIESLSSFYDWASKRRSTDISYNPAGVVLEQLDKVRRERPDTATWENGKRIIQEIPDPRDKTAAILMAKTGARTKEVLTVKEEDLMLDDGFIRFKDRKGGTTTKNPLDDEAVQAVRRLQAVSSDDSEFMFTAIHGGRVKRERIRREVRRAAVRAGVMESEDEQRWHYKFTPHYYRTIFTSLMRNSEPGLKDHWVGYLRGDSDQSIKDLYTRTPHEKIRKRYLETIKPLNLY
ncbi:site-specific integrase [Haloarcula japonica]|uniref:site-specific integrase n=1 Tax=Haloarcula japonica TaxID=29282 RepID=UPI0039F6D6BD